MGFQENEGNNTGIFGEKNRLTWENAPGKMNHNLQSCAFV
jgi:hypothetical protein